MSGGEHSAGITRAEALRRGVLASGSVLTLGGASPYVRQALALAGDSDADTLNLLLLFEYVQVELYEGGLKRLAAGPELRQLIELLAEQENEHVAALKKEIEKVGGKPIPQRDYAVFAYRFSTYFEIFRRLGWELERSTIAAYNGAIPLLKSKDAQRLTASILQVDARHAAVLAMRNGEEPAPEAFDEVRTEFGALNSLLRWRGTTANPVLEQENSR